MAVCLQERAKNQEIGATDATAKEVDKLYSSASVLYKKIITNKLRKNRSAQEGRRDSGSTGAAGVVISSTLLGAYVNGTLLLQWIRRDLEGLVQTTASIPSPLLRLQLLEECKGKITQFLQMDGIEQLAELYDIIQKRLEEVEEFETILVFKDKMEAFQHSLRQQPWSHALRGRQGWRMLLLTREKVKFPEKCWSK